MHTHGITSQFPAQLTDCLHERCTFDIADGAADFSDDKIQPLIQPLAWLHDIYATPGKRHWYKIKAVYAAKARVFELDGVSVDAWDSEGYWANVRMSNTEPLVRLNLEGKTKEIMEAKRDEFLAIIRS